MNMKLNNIFALFLLLFVLCDVELRVSFLYILLRIHLKFSTILKTSNASVWSNAFLLCKSMYILKAYSIHYTLRQKVNVKKISFGQKKQCKKMPSFFFRDLHLITVLLLICDSYKSWSTRFVSLKLCVGFSIFDSVSFLLKFIFLFNKMYGLFDFKTS